MISLYKPRHKGTVKANGFTEAKCSHDGMPGACTASRLCPRHFPDGYTDYLARHATDSI